MAQLRRDAIGPRTWRPADRDARRERVWWWGKGGAGGRRAGEVGEGRGRWAKGGEVEKWATGGVGGGGGCRKDEGWRRWVGVLGGQHGRETVDALLRACGATHTRVAAAHPRRETQAAGDNTETPGET